MQQQYQLWIRLIVFCGSKEAPIAGSFGRDWWFPQEVFANALSFPWCTLQREFLLLHFPSLTALHTSPLENGERIHRFRSMVQSAFTICHSQQISFWNPIILEASLVSLANTVSNNSKQVDVGNSQRLFSSPHCRSDSSLSSTVIAHCKYTISSNILSGACKLRPPLPPSSSNTLPPSRAAASLLLYPIYDPPVEHEIDTRLAAALFLPTSFATVSLSLSAAR